MNVSTSLIKCKRCRSVLMAAAVGLGVVEIKCRKTNCKALNLIDMRRGAVKITIVEDSTLFNKQYVVL